MGYSSYSLKFILDVRTVKSGGLNPVYVRLIFNRKKTEIALHELVDPQRWSSDTGRIIKPKDNYEQYLNQKLNRIENQLNTIRLQLEADNEEVSGKRIKDVFLGRETNEKILLLDFFSTYIQEITAKREHSEGVLRHYKQIRAKLETYLKGIGAEGLQLERLSRKHIVGFETYILTTPVPILNKPISRNTANNYLKKFKAVVNQALRSELIKSNPFSNFKLHNMQTNRTALTSAELSALVNANLSDSPTREKVKNIFIFSVFTGLRFSDAMALKEENLTTDAESGRIFISIIQQKTKIPVQIPLLAPAKQIIDFYTQQREVSGYLLPRISNQRCNSYLREIAGIVGIKTKISHHVARHTFATVVLLDNDIDLKSVSNLLGHDSIKSTEGYSKTTKNKLARLAKLVEAKYKKPGSKEE